MKCLKNVKTGSIVRVDDKQAHQMAGLTWKYVSKSEWRGVKEPETIVTHDMGGPIETKVEKKSKKVAK
jgi:hypothetical protein